MEEINKPATIVRITGEKISLKITSCSACQNCMAKGLCGLSETVDKTIEITTPEAKNFCDGEEVIVSLSSKQGFKAVIYGYVLPLCLLLAAIILTHASGFDDFISGISGIIVLIPYYFGVFCAKDKLKSGLEFKISKKNNH